ncbi:hypothetical protein BH23ACT11_BH23ACT11_10140 [soil metagenome]
MSVQYLTDKTGKRLSVVLPIEVYEKLLEEMEEMEDVRLYDEAKAEVERGEDEVIPLEQAIREIREGKVTGE